MGEGWKFAEYTKSYSMLTTSVLVDPHKGGDQLEETETNSANMPTDQVDTETKVEIPRYDT